MRSPDAVKIGGQMVRMTYSENISDHERHWYRLDEQLFACCDCGLIHRIEMKRKFWLFGPVYARFERDQIATDAARKEVDFPRWKPSL